MSSPKILSSLLLLASFVNADTVPSPVDVRIGVARRQLLANPKMPAALNSLAFALLRKGRDARDEVTYKEADSFIEQSLRVAPANFDAQKLKVAVLLGLNQPSDALKLGQQLNKKVPDDISLWALLVDSYVALGNYEQAERSAQWVLDLRPGSSIGFEKAAVLREWFGDTEGAIEFIDEANRRTSQNDADEKAWLLTQKARLVLAGGNAKVADTIVTEALRLFPGSQVAEAVLAQVRMAEGNYPDALNLLEARYHKVPTAENLYDWADGLAAAGKTQDAALQFANFEKQARGSHAAILDLATYYSDRKFEPAQALDLAQGEAKNRQDSPTLAVYAWALYRTGKYAEAKAQMDNALAVGVHNALYLCHAVAIANSNKDGASADRYSKQLNALPVSSCSADTSLQSANEVKR